MHVLAWLTCGMQSVLENVALNLSSTLMWYRMHVASCLWASSAATQTERRADEWAAVLRSSAGRQRPHPGEPCVFFKDINWLNGLFKSGCCWGVRRRSAHNQQRSAALSQPVESHGRLSRGKTPSEGWMWGCSRLEKPRRESFSKFIQHILLYASFVSEKSRFLPRKQEVDWISLLLVTFSTSSLTEQVCIITLVKNCSTQNNH